MSATPAKNWFDQGGANYARFRPEYPAELAEALARQAGDTSLAVDVGCGTGQLTRLLAAHFDRVIGTDPSADQIASAKGPENVEYAVAAAESLSVVADGSANLITAAQAAHWFDLPRFYAEVRRIAAPPSANSQGAVLALISYGTPTLDAAAGINGQGRAAAGDSKLNDLFQDFYWNQIGRFWPPERKLVDEGYRSLDFPFRGMAMIGEPIVRALTLDEFLGYVSTWSAVRAAREANRSDLLETFASELARMWGDADQPREVAWPLNVRIGRVTS